MKKIKKDELIEALSRWGKIYLREEKGYKEQMDTVLFMGKPEKSVKDIVLPPEEILLIYHKKGKDIEQEDVFDTEKRVIFGVLPCDVKALYAVDRNFLRDPQDPYYKKRRDSMLIVTTACVNPDEHCFCTSLGYGPFEKLGDIFVFDASDYYLAEGLTEKGRHAIDWKNFEDASEQDLLEMKKAKGLVENKIQKYDLQIESKKLYSAFGDSIWEDMSFRCLNCGACTFYCPTCYCFDIEDVERTNWGYRERVWDSCMFLVYSLETSGHNPRQNPAWRVRNRIMHKFAYYPETYGEFGCVGCGRCIDVCPSGFDIREAILSLKGMEVGNES